MAQIRFEQVTKRFRELTVVKELDLTIRDGEFFTFVGPSGCGKSTLLNMIAGLETVSGGRILFDDTLVNDFSPGDRDVAMVFQSYALYPHMTVFENIAFPLRMKKVHKNTISDEVKRVSDLLGLSDLLRRKPRELSGGQRQRVALGRALIRKPKVFLMDEPLSNLDARLRIEMRAELKRLHQELRITTVYVTHDQSEALSLSDRIAVFHQGEIQQCGTPRDVYGKPANIFVGGFIGSPPMNFIKGIIKNKSPLQIECNGRVLSPSVERLPAGNNVIAGIRPEDILVSYKQTAASIDARVIIRELAGSFNWIDVEWDGTRLKGHAPADMEIQAGTRAWLELPADRIVVFDADSGNRL
ncbi:MAG: ABC transporter ATP-binding protein [Nitrospirota bacterium]